MHTKVKLLAVASIALGIGTPGAFADPKPQGAKTADPQLIANFLAGKTQNWKNCKGGIYYGANWQAEAWCEREGKSVGIGTWNVDRNGQVCHELTWYWKKGDGVGSKKDVVDKEDCHQHVVDQIGTIWRSWGGEKDWWPLASNKSFVKGFKHKSKVNRLRKQLGI